MLTTTLTRTPVFLLALTALASLTTGCDLSSCVADPGGGGNPDSGSLDEDASVEPFCGDGIVSWDETCDIAVAEGMEGACPIACGGVVEVCEESVLVGSDCTSECVVQPIEDFVDGDGCCPTGATYLDDGDCDPPTPVCGNGVVEPGEACDDANDDTWDGCVACQSVDPRTQCIEEAFVERGESGACIDCMCEDACRADLDLCYNATDRAAGGPAAGELKSELCADVVDCARDSGCSGTDCYGILSAGPCRGVIQAAAESTGLTTVLARQSDLSYALGRANQVGVCSSDFCSAACY